MRARRPVRAVVSTVALGRARGMTSTALDPWVGARVWLAGQGWEVAKLTGDSVRLLREGQVRTVSVTSLAGSQNTDSPAGSADSPVHHL